MVLTDRQREDLHAGIYEYLKSREEFVSAAAAFAEADPTATNKKTNNVGKTPLLEKKWTAIPRLQKKVLELERVVAQNAKIHAHRMGGEGAAAGNGNGSSVQRRMLPRLPCNHTLQGHSASVTCVQVHPVFTVVVSGSEDGTIKIWDHESGEYMKTLKGHTNSVSSLAFTPAGNYLASCSNDLSIKLWDFTTHACVRTLRGHDHTISAILFIPFQNVISSGDDNVNMDVAAANTKQLLSASRDHTVKLWDLETGFCDHTFTDHTEWVRTLAVRKHDGGVWASSGNDQVIFVYESAATRNKICELRGHEHVVESLSFVVEESFPKTTVAYQSANAKHKETVRDYLASASRDRTVRLWSIATASCIAVFSAHENWVKAVLIHPSGNYIVSGGDDRTIRVFDIKAQRCLRTLDNAHAHFVSSLDMHHTLPIMVSGGVDQVLKTWVLD